MPNVMYWGEGGQYGPFDVQEDVWPDAGLECIEGQARGDFLYHVRELLVSNDLLAKKIVKDQGQFALAYVYANNAVRVAKSLEDAELQAAATYTRGCTKLEWGLFGTTQQGIFQIDRGKAKDAIRDFQAILQKTDIQQEGIHPQLQGFTMLQLSRAQSFF